MSKTHMIYFKTKNVFLTYLDYVQVPSTVGDKPFPLDSYCDFLCNRHN